MSTLTNEQCAQVLRGKLLHDQFSIKSHQMEHNERFMGFFSSQAKLVISAKVRGRDETHSFFVKTTAEKPELNEKLWSVHKVFLKEYLVRDQLLKDLSKNAPSKITADMYLGDPRSIIVLEDLNDLGYEMCRMKSPDLDHARICMKALANFHSSSIFLQANLKEPIEKTYKNSFFETLVTFPNGRNSPCLLFSIISQIRLLAGELVDDIPGEIKLKIIDKATERILSLVRPSVEHVNVVCHGDAWGNNVLYTYDNDKPTSALLVDFQVVRFAPPAIDIVHYLYSSFSAEFRLAHSKELIQYYYDALSNCLLEKKVDINDILPEKTFLKSIEDYNEFGVLIRAFYMMTRLPAESLQLINESQEKFFDALAYGGIAVFRHAFTISDEFKKDVIESLSEMFKFYLNAQIGDS